MDEPISIRTFIFLKLIVCFGCLTQKKTFLRTKKSVTDMLNASRVNSELKLAMGNLIDKIQ